MSQSFKIGFNKETGEKFRFFIETGQILFILGANGTGKSSLITQIFGRHHQQAKKISAHRQTWFASNSLDMTPQSRNDYERNIQSQDQQIHARYREEYAQQRAGIAIYDLIDSDTMLEREIAALVRSDEIEAAQKKQKHHHQFIKLMNLCAFQIYQ